MSLQLVRDPEHALNVYSRAVLGVNPDELGSPWAAAFSSLGMFAVGALVPPSPLVSHITHQRGGAFAPARWCGGSHDRSSAGISQRSSHVLLGIAAALGHCLGHCGHIFRRPAFRCTGVIALLCHVCLSKAGRLIYSQLALGALP
jgi:hypothetical protein